MIEVVSFEVDGHWYVYRFDAKHSSEFVWRVYQDSRDPKRGFSLSYVLLAIRRLG
jgi:hypothetical protein